MNSYATIFACAGIIVGGITLACLFAMRLAKRQDAAREPADTFDREAWEAQDNRRCRTTALADAQERDDIDAAIRRQSELHGRTHVHAGARRANLEAGARR